MNEEAAEWISAHSKESYSSYCKIDSFQDRFRNLIPLYVALGTGYYFMGTRFPHYYSDGHFAFFYISYSIGLLLLVVSVLLILYSMFWMARLELSGDPLNHYEICDSIQGDYPKGAVKFHLDLQAAKKRCEASSNNLQHFWKRSSILNKASKVGVISFLLLLAAAPRFISTVWYESIHAPKVLINTSSK